MDYQLLLSLVPPLSAIVIAMATKRIIPSLLIGLWIGSFILSPGFVTSMSEMTKLIVKTLSIPGNMNVLLFLYLFSGFVAILELSGGIEGFSKWIENVTSNKKMTLLWVWLLTPITFIDCAFRVVATGSIMKKNIKKQNINREKFAFMLNNSASPIVAIVPIGTAFVGYMVGVIESGLDVADLDQSAYLTFIRSIPFNFFSIASIIISLLYLFKVIEFKHSRDITELEESEQEPNDSNSMEEMRINSEVNPKPWNLLIPIILLIPLSLYLMYWTSEGDDIVSILASVDASHAMLLALIITTLLSVILYRTQRIDVKTQLDHFIKGGNRMVNTIAILAVAWPIARVSKELGLPDLVTSTVGDQLPSYLIPFIIFTTTCLVTFFIGSSWGSWALMMPLAIPLAVTSGVSLPLAAGAVFAGGTFGDVASPISGMVAMASGTAEANHMKYVSLQLPYNLIAAVIAALGFLVVPFII